MGLADRKCEPCKGGVPPLKGAALAEYHAQVPSWQVASEHHLVKKWKFPDFAKAMEFVNRVGALAEQEGHHPWIHFTWGIVRIELWTHKIDGLHASDFILAAKIDRL
jgi:4a-hydroxytetrahydrobiopterin dehydratase